MIYPCQPLRPWKKCEFCNIVKNENDVCSSKEEYSICDTKNSWRASSHKTEQRNSSQRKEEIRKDPKRVEALDRAKLRLYNEYSKVLLSNCLEHLDEGDLKTTIKEFLKKERT